MSQNLQKIVLEKKQSLTVSETKMVYCVVDWIELKENWKVNWMVE